MRYGRSRYDRGRYDRAATIVVVPATGAGDLVDAICLRLQSDSAVKALLSADRDGVACVHSGRAPRGTALPFVVVIDPQDSADEFQSYEDDGTLPADATGTIQVSCFAASRRGVQAIVKAVKAALRHEDLTFSDGELLMLRPTGGGIELDEDLATGAVDCWHGLVTYAYTIAYTVDA